MLLSTGVAVSTVAAAPISLSNATGQWQNAVLAPAGGGSPMSTLILTDGAGNGPELRKALDEIYQGRILAEVSPLGELEPDSR